MKRLFAVLCVLSLSPMVGHASAASACDQVAPSVQFAAASLAEIYHDNDNNRPDALMEKICEMRSSVQQNKDGSEVVSFYSAKTQQVECSVQLIAEGGKFQYESGSCN